MTSPPLRTSGLAAAGSGPLPAQRADDAITLRRPPGDPAVAAAVDPTGGAAPRPGRLASLVEALDEDARVTLPRAPTAPPPGAARALAAIRDPDAGTTEPSMPVLGVGDERRAGWAAGLAARVDAALDSDSWSKETPVAGPTSAELRMLLGQADPTRQQPVEDIERLQRRAAELGDQDPRDVPRRSPHPTAEVDPDDIEAAIEVAPPARRQAHPNAISAAKPRKPE